MTGKGFPCGDDEWRNRIPSGKDAGESFGSGWVHDWGEQHPESADDRYKARDIAAPGADLPGVVPALDFLMMSSRLAFSNSVPLIKLFKLVT